MDAYQNLTVINLNTTYIYNYYISDIYAIGSCSIINVTANHVHTFPCERLPCAQVNMGCSSNNKNFPSKRVVRNTHNYPSAITFTKGTIQVLLCSCQDLIKILQQSCHVND